MTYTFRRSDGRLQLEKTKAFCELLNFTIPPDNKLITELIKELDDEIKESFPYITREALSNAHGDWYELLIAIKAWNYHIDNPNSFLALLLPNVRVFDVAKLYKNELNNLILDLREKVQVAASVQLVTSNPDFVILDTQNIEVPELFNNRIETITEESIRLIKDAYQEFISKCDFNDIDGYLAVKSSLRPDRRLQIAHEGSLMKAIYIHLQTRQWIINPRGLKYYAIATKVGDSDRKALKTVATHSIITVHDKPQAAVDEIYEVNSLSDANDVFKTILH